MCDKCYQAARRQKQPPAICHPDRKTHARGLCKQCYAFESVDTRIVASRHADWPYLPQDERLQGVIQLQCLMPASAKNAFMIRFKELFG